VGRGGRLASVDFAQFKTRQAEIWGLGDYSSLSPVLEPAARALCDACAVSAGQEVLDVAAGDGNFALACAREGASVVASDLAPAMVQRGRRRTDEEGYNVEWLEADAEDLKFEDSRFDCVASNFGAVFAPRPEVVARELFRVTRSGGTVGLTAWTPGSFNAELAAVARRYAPPPPDLPPGEQWGDEDTALERLDSLTGRVELDHRSVVLESPSPEAFVSMFEADAPQQVAARRTLSPEQLDTMHAETLEVATRWNGGDGPIRIEAEYLLIVARKRG
jgi:SAM-dependent methyltransferase